MRTAMLALFLFAPLALGCASTGGAPQKATGSNRNLINREQLDAMPSITARDAVERLHRDWLRGRGGSVQTTSGRVYPVVFVDGRRFGELPVLRQFGVEEIEEIRFLSASDATTRFGTGYPGGIINLILRRLEN